MFVTVTPVLIDCRALIRGMVGVNSYGRCAQVDQTNDIALYYKHNPKQSMNIHGPNRTLISKPNT